MCLRCHFIRYGCLDPLAPSLHVAVGRRCTKLELPAWGESILTSSNEHLLALAEQALARYRIRGADIRLIRHNENAAFDVTDGGSGRRYLLRVHRPVSANLVGVQHTFEGLCAEMEILRAFRAGTGIPLQEPVRNEAGLYVTVATDQAAGAGQAVSCTLLTWVEGDALDGKDPRLPELVPEMGRLAARMHRFARSWLPAVPLSRPVYDFAKYRYLVHLSAAGVAQGVFSQDRYDILLETMQAIEPIYAAPPTPQTWGIIHADLGPGNWVLTPGADGTPVPIDWCFSGWGPYLFDVGGMVPGFKPHLRPLFMAGYQQEAGALTAAELRFCDACFILSILGAVGFHISNPVSHEWIARRMPWWVDQYCRLFLAGQSPALADEETGTS